MSRTTAREDQEARLQLAADKLDNGQHDSLRKAVVAHNVPEATLRHQRKGHHTKKDAHANQQALLPIAETALLKHIQHCAYSSFPLMPALIREYTNDAIRAVPGRFALIGRAALTMHVSREPRRRSSIIGKRHTVREQQQMQGIPATWCFSKSDTSWTNNELAIEWLENIFEPNTRLLLPSEWHLLIINSHCSHTSKVFCNVLWSHQIILYLLPAHAMHIMQPLDVLIFGPLTAAYCHIINTATEHVDAIDKAQFRTFYTQAWEKVLMQSAAWKAFLDSGISLDPSPEKVLQHLPGCSTPTKASRTPLQELAVPCSTSAFNAMLNATLNAHTQEPSSREFAKHELVAKGQSRSRRMQGNCQEEEEVIASPLAAAPDGNDASEDDDEGGLMSLTTPPPPPMWTFLDELDGKQPLDMIDEVDPGSFRFFDTLPQAGPSCTKH
ncbi:related to transposases [Sporisorium reilianum f. sp. reilianum]|uniref:Related to transposases n=1 Tax=Sporisorium reilianum f. sp. reilianum TaxID=72559 RepID=A0A2N8UNQ9_9BASI|nr:related to transposases [Sporisorium reilianum f. sp. reilianum]